MRSACLLQSGLYPGGWGLHRRPGERVGALRAASARRECTPQWSRDHESGHVGLASRRSAEVRTRAVDVPRGEIGASRGRSAKAITPMACDGTCDISHKSTSHIRYMIRYPSYVGRSPK